MARLKDGFSTTITFASGSLTLEEISVTPPGIEGGGENDTTTMQNTAWRTRQPKKLKTLSEGSITVSYDTVVYTQIIAMLNVNQLITITYPDASTLAFWGWIDTFVPGELVEGEQPTAEMTIIPSNENGSGVETAPVHTP